MFFANRVPPKARHAYTLDAWSGILSGVMIGLAFPFFAVIARKKLGASDIQIAILTMAPVMGNLFSFFWAKWMDGRRKMPFAFLSWVVGRAMLLPLIFFVSAPVYVVIISLFWLITSISGPAYSAMICEMYPDGDRARIMGYVRVCMWFAAILITLAAGPLLEHNVVSYRVLFPVAGIFGIISAAIYARIPTAQALGDKYSSLWEFIKSCFSVLREDKAYAWFCGGIFIYGFANFMATPIYTLYEIDVLHAYATRQSIYSLTIWVATMVSCYYWGSHVDRKRPEKMVIVQELLWALIPLTYPFIRIWWALLPTKALAGALGAGVDLAYLNGVLYFAPRDRMMQYQAIFAVLMGIRGFMAPLLGGVLKQSGVLSMQQLFIVATLAILGSAVVQVIGAKKYAPLESAGR